MATVATGISGKKPEARESRGTLTAK